MRWGWSAGRQNEAEFEILKAYLCAAWLLPPQGIKEIFLRQHPKRPFDYSHWEVVWYDIQAIDRRLAEEYLYPDVRPWPTITREIPL